MCTFVVMYMYFPTLLSICWWQSYAVMDAHFSIFTGHRPLSAEQPGSGSRLNTARRLLDVTVHYMHHGLNTVLPLTRIPSSPYIDRYGLQHVITVIGSFWRDPHQSSLVGSQWGLWSNMPCQKKAAREWLKWPVGLCCRITGAHWCCVIIPQMWTSSACNTEAGSKCSDE